MGHPTSFNHPVCEPHHSPQALGLPKKLLQALSHFIAFLGRSRDSFCTWKSWNWWKWLFEILTEVQAAILKKNGKNEKQSWCVISHTSLRAIIQSHFLCHLPEVTASQKHVWARKENMNHLGLLSWNFKSSWKLKLKYNGHFLQILWSVLIYSLLKACGINFQVYWVGHIGIWTQDIYWECWDWFFLIMLLK